MHLVRTPSLHLALLSFTLAATGACRSDEAPDDSNVGDDTADTGDTAGDDTGAPNTDPTWYDTIQPIVMENCAGCHFSGSGIAYSVFDNYEGAKAYSSLMLAKIVGDVNVPYTMPPFPPPDLDAGCEIPGPIANDTRLSAEDAAAFQAWVNSGAPEGDPETAAPYTRQEPPVLSGDEVMLFPGVNTDVPAVDTTVEGEIDYDYTRCNSIEVSGETAELINALQVVQDPASNGFVHHVIVGTDPWGVSYTGADGGDPHDGQFHKCETDEIPDSVLLFTYTPGGFPLYFPEKSAMELAPHSRFIFTVHYHKQTTAFHDDTTLALRMTTEEPLYMAYMSRFGAASRRQDEWSYQQRGADGGWDLDSLENKDDFPFLLKPDVADYHMVWKEDNDFTGDYRVWGVFPHLHYAGKSIRISFDHADGSETCLASIPEFDFNWQLTYIYDLPAEKLPLFSHDDTTVIDCHYDNTWDNQRLAEGMRNGGFDQLFDIRIGENSFDEMCVMHYGMLVPWGESVEVDQ